MLGGPALGAARSSRRKQKEACARSAGPQPVRGHVRLGGRALCPRCKGNSDPPSLRSAGERAQCTPGDPSRKAGPSGRAAGTDRGRAGRAAGAGAGVGRCGARRARPFASAPRRRSSPAAAGSRFAQRPAQIEGWGQSGPETPMKRVRGRGSGRGTVSWTLFKFRFLKEEKSVTVNFFFFLKG